MSADSISLYHPAAFDDLARDEVVEGFAEFNRQRGQFCKMVMALLYHDLADYRRVNDDYYIVLGKCILDATTIESAGRGTKLSVPGDLAVLAELQFNSLSIYQDAFVFTARSPFLKDGDTRTTHLVFRTTSRIAYRTGAIGRVAFGVEGNAVSKCQQVFAPLLFNETLFEERYEDTGHSYAISGDSFVCLNAHGINITPDPDEYLATCTRTPTGMEVKRSEEITNAILCTLTHSS